MLLTIIAGCCILFGLWKINNLLENYNQKKEKERMRKLVDSINKLPFTELLEIISCFISIPSTFEKGTGFKGMRSSIDRENYRILDNPAFLVPGKRPFYFRPFDPDCFKLVMNFFAKRENLFATICENSFQFNTPKERNKEEKESTDKDFVRGYQRGLETMMTEAYKIEILKLLLLPENKEIVDDWLLGRDITPFYNIGYKIGLIKLD
jgi:hypothetical protein